MNNCSPCGAFLQRSELLALKWEENWTFMLQKILIWCHQKYFGTGDLILVFRDLPLTAMILPMILTVLNVVQFLREDGAGYFLLWIEISIIHFQFCLSCEKEVFGISLVQVPPSLSHLGCKLNWELGVRAEWERRWWQDFLKYFYIESAF